MTEDIQTSGEPEHAKPGPKPEMTAAQRVLRDAAIIAALHAGEEVREIAKRYALTTRQINRVKNGFELRRTALEDRPMEVIERVLRLYEQQMHSFAVVAEDTIERAPAASVGALKGFADALERYRLLLASIGKLPDNLELFRAESEMRRVGKAMVEKLGQVARGEISAVDAMDALDRLLAPPSSGWIEGHAVDASDEGEAA